MWVFLVKGTRPVWYLRSLFRTTFWILNLTNARWLCDLIILSIVPLLSCFPPIHHIHVWNVQQSSGMVRNGRDRVITELMLGLCELQKALNAAESWLGHKLSSHFLFLLLPQQDMRWEAPHVKTYPETQMILSWLLNTFLLVDHTGNGTQNSHTGEKGVVEQPAQLEDWIHIMVLYTNQEIGCPAR